MDGPLLPGILPVLLLVASVGALAVLLLVMGNFFNPRRPGPVKRMPYESGMDPIHDARRRFNVRFHLLAIAFLVFDVELLFLYPWAVVFRAEPAAAQGVHQSTQIRADSAPATSEAVAEARAQGPARAADRHARPPLLFLGGMVFVGLLVLGLVYDWRKGIFEWR
jgi:NADH-quinone oxidoreductase subunit A